MLKMQVGQHPKRVSIGNCNGMVLAGTAIKSYSIHCYRFVLATVAKACLGTLAWERDQVTSKT